MQIFAHSVGEDKIIFSESQVRPQNPLPPEVEALQSWIEVRDGLGEKRERRADMNPRGFYEGWPCMGIPWSLRNHQRIKEIESEPSRRVAKIVGEGLLKTNPEYIESLVVVLRPPRFVANSQEKLVGPINIRDRDQGMHNVRREAKVHNPDFWISHMIGIARWAKEFPEVPVHVIEYENLLDKESREGELARLQDFIGEGDFVNEGAKAVEPSLRRSSPREGNSPEVESDFVFADSLYPLLLKQDWKDVVKSVGERNRKKLKQARNSKPENYLCYRVNLPVHRNTCLECIKGGTVMSNLKKRAEDTDVNWIKEPCVFECALRIDEEAYKTPEDSIKNNFWRG